MQKYSIGTSHSAGASMFQSQDIVSHSVGMSSGSGRLRCGQRFAVSSPMLLYQMMFLARFIWTATVRGVIPNESAISTALNHAKRKFITSVCLSVKSSSENILYQKAKRRINYSSLFTINLSITARLNAIQTAAP
jgi:hypothetical protein